MNKYDEMINYMKNKGLDIIDSEICKLMASIGEIFNPSNILDPNAGMGEILYFCDFGKSLDAYSINEDYISAGRDIDNRINFIQKSFLEKEMNNKYDLVISQIPFTYGVDPIKGVEVFRDIEFLQKIFDVLEKNGVVVALLPGRFLCEEYSKNMRREILEKYSLEMVIEIPYDLYKIKGHDVNIVVIKNTEQRDKVLMKVYNGDIQNIVCEYITQNGGEFVDKNLLNVRWDKYYNSEEFNWLNFYEPQYYKTIGELSKVLYGPMLLSQNKEGEVLIIKKNNIENAKIVSKQGDDYVSAENTERFESYILRHGDILVNHKMNSSHNIFQYTEEMPKAMPSLDYINIRPEDEYFCEFVNTIAGKRFLETQFTRLLKGPGKNLSVNDIEKVKIPLFDIDDIRLIEKVNTNKAEEKEVIARLEQIKSELNNIRAKKERKEKEILELLNNELKSKNDNSNKLIEKLIKENEENKKKIIELEERAELNKELLNCVKGIKGTVGRIDTTTKENSKELKTIGKDLKESKKMIKDIYDMVQDLHKIQDKTLAKLNALTSEEEKETIYKKLSENIWELINEKYEMSVKNKFNEIEKKYESKFTNEGWQKLDEATRNFLITSKVVYYDLEQYDDVIDFSPCCIATTKALEREIFLNIFKKMQMYFMSNKDCNMKYLPDGLVYYDKKNDKYNYKIDDKFTLGSVPYLLATKFERDQKNDETSKSNKQASVREFLNSSLFKEKSFKNNNELDNYIKIFSDKVEEITNKYRNKSAHRNEVKKTQAEECYNLMMVTEKILVEFVHKLL